MKPQHSNKNRRTGGNILSEHAGTAKQAGKRACFGVAMMAALGLTVSAVIVTSPSQNSEAAAASLPTAADAIALQQGDLSGFFKNDALITLSLPDVELESAFIKNAFREPSRAEASKDFSDYVSAWSEKQNEKAQNILAEQARQKAEEEARLREAAEKAEQERIQAELAAQQQAIYEAQALQRQQAAQAAQMAIWQSGSHVGLNNQGVPMSEKPGDVPLDAYGVPLNYSRCITGIATAYTNDPITSTGTVPIQGTVAVDPSIIPYGTRMWITSADGQYVYGLAIAEDTGGFIYLGNAPKADLYMYSEADCDEWGWREANIYILD